ncbi:MAG: methyltransferase domain-containing protein [Pirellulaceae bacterium]|nr:methyltransferase domain-containing protein [Pirellulaceae bacterium]
MSKSPPIDTDKITDMFDSLADQYDSQCEQVGYLGPRLVADLLRECQLPEADTIRILDAGCGTGLLGPALGSQSRWLDGVDLSTRMLDMARQRGCYRGLITAELTEYLTGTDTSYHLIAAVSVLQYQGSLEQFIQVALKRLVLGGWLVFNVAAGPLLGDGYDWHTDGFYSHSPQYVMRLLGEAGVAGGGLRRLAWPCPCPFSEHALVFAVQRPVGLAE